MNNQTIIEKLKTLKSLSTSQLSLADMRQLVNQSADELIEFLSPTPSQDSIKSITLNFEGVSHWNPVQLFENYAHQLAPSKARYIRADGTRLLKWIYDHSTQYQENGYFKQLPPGCDVIISTNDWKNRPDSDITKYYLWWEGSKDAEFKFGLNAKNITKTPEEYRDGWRIEFQVLRRGNINLALTEIPEDYPKNWRIWKIGDDVAEERIFSGKIAHRDEIKSIEDLNVDWLRSMGAFKTNGNMSTTFEEFIHPDSNTFANVGVPPKHFCQIAKESNSDPWICIPHLMGLNLSLAQPHLGDLESIDKLAETVFTEMDGKGHPLELSNETWQDRIRAFPQGQHYRALAVQAFGEYLGTIEAGGTNTVKVDDISKWIPFGAGAASIRGGLTAYGIAKIDKENSEVSFNKDVSQGIHHIYAVDQKLKHKVRDEYVAMRSHQLFTRYKQKWAELGGNPNDITCIVGGLSANSYIGQTRLTADLWKQNQERLGVPYVDPKSEIDVLAITGYFGGASQNDTDLYDKLNEVDFDDRALPILRDYYSSDDTPGGLGLFRERMEENLEVIKDSNVKIEYYESWIHAVQSLRPDDWRDDRWVPLMDKFQTSEYFIPVLEKRDQIIEETVKAKDCLFAHYGQATKAGIWALMRARGLDNPVSIWYKGRTR